MKTTLKKLVSIAWDAMAMFCICLSATCLTMLASELFNWNIIICYIVVAVIVFFAVFFYLENKYNQKNKQ